MHRYYSTKHYPSDRGLSCAFRQWRAESHCRFIHGYAFAVTFIFAANELDHRGWVVDFGGLKDLFGMLADTFDHKLLVAKDDPWLSWFEKMNKEPADHKPLDLVIVDQTGCEAFASLIYGVTEQWLKDAGYGKRVSLHSVEVKEHDGNSAIATTGEFIKEKL